MLKHSPPLPRLASVLLASLLLTLTACPGDEGTDEDGGTNITDGGQTDAGPDGGDPNKLPDGGSYDPGAQVCGDGKVQKGEACDDANTVSGDGCVFDCKEIEVGFECPQWGRPCVIATACGNGIVEEGEACDDRNKESNDGCKADCSAVETGWSCPFQGQRCRAAECGDKIIAGEEECEDGNTANGDGCSNTCRLEQGYKCDGIGQPCTKTTCGDGKKEGTEQCDDGNHDMGDGCSPLCVLEPKCTNGNCTPVCGDGVILPGDTTEQCDDGNTRNNDGCSSDCKLEDGFACVRVTDTLPNAVEIPVVYRDFRGKGQPVGGKYPAAIHPDFDDKNGSEKGIVGAEFQGKLNAKGKPTYAKEGTTSGTTSGAANFNQWYNDVKDINLTEVSTLKLNRLGTTGATYRFDNPAFFPLDNSGWVGLGLENRGANNHNFSFTSETRYWFQFKGNELLEFNGDDDVWVYINGTLALDLGGVHGALDGSVNLADATVVSKLGLVKDKIYEVVVFQAERHQSASSYKLTLTNFQTERTTCESTCGNGKVDKGETCDNGNANGPGYGKCSLTCIWNARCGDGITQYNYGETCDDGNTNDRDACPNNCQIDPG
ncbi:DUF4215 domain-containing protein [Corallococcus exiguus]|uniref:DUF4215 domain-containing protein n=1 Tax=Corallococcus TaxID=83461 RepID=UPI000EC385A1|nr:MULTISPECIES: DUF4215 domain-containing protein [Corallococcus]NNB91201.1 DUF4215 domain-containing protein [Corallococcus exiguus]NNB99261.1 DUF4215 domain-containing protein [Corallococcus exiguus]NNC05080.1 DUF4215 domain-containing protein [Corallococcus exiguus]NPC51928.1 DUF4215 domain-containing protein [Corallococcus exiguus]RKH75129.1 DUF4215 domain-containing protein [Corallococcus sp. AB032C]